MSRRQLVSAGVGAGLLAWLAVVAFSMVATQAATAQTVLPPTDPPPTIIKVPPSVTDPPQTSPPQTSPPETSPPATSPRPVFVPFVAPPKATPTTKPRNSQATTPAANIVPGTVATPAPTVAAVANPQSPPAIDPRVQVAGREVTRNDAVERLIANTSTGGGNPTLGTVLLVAVIAVLPIGGAMALGLFGDTRSGFRRFGHRHL